MAAVLNGLAATQAERLDWQHSIVDLLKLVELDSSLAARKELATDLGYTGALDGSAAMNLWLHKAVMKKLADNGGKVRRNCWTDGMCYTRGCLGRGMQAQARGRARCVLWVCAWHLWCATTCEQGQVTCMRGGAMRRRPSSAGSARVP